MAVTICHQKTIQTSDNMSPEREAGGTGGYKMSPLYFPKSTCGGYKMSPYIYTSIPEVSCFFCLSLLTGEETATMAKHADLPRFWALYERVVGDKTPSPSTKRNNRKGKGGEKNEKRQLSNTEGS